MPHKVNPIDIENSESCLGMGNSILNHLKDNLQISRYQRDAIDNTLLRNVGLGLGYSLVGYKQIIKGYGYFQPDKQFMIDFLDQHYELLGEALNMIMKKNDFKEPYQLIKNMTRGKKFTKE